MSLSLKVRLLDDGTGQTEVVVEVDGRVARGTVANAELFSGRESVLFYETPGPGLRPSVATRRAAVTKQERKMGALHGGRNQSGSGARPDKKGDFRTPGKYRGECKSTTRKAYRLDLAELTKLRSECTGLEVPVFVLEFQDKQTLRPIDSWTLIPTKVWKERA